MVNKYETKQNWLIKKKNKIPQKVPNVIESQSDSRIVPNRRQTSHENTVQEINIIPSRGGLVVELWTDSSLPSAMVGSNLRQAEILETTFSFHKFRAVP